MQKKSVHTVCLLCQLPAACRNCLPLDALDVLLGAGQAKTSSKEVAGIIRYAGEHPETFADRSSNAVNIYQIFKCCSGFEEGWVRIAACPKPHLFFPSLCDIFMHGLRMQKSHGFTYDEHGLIFQNESRTWMKPMSIWTYDSMHCLFANGILNGILVQR